MRRTFIFLLVMVLGCTGSAQADLFPTLATPTPSVEVVAPSMTPSPDDGTYAEAHPDIDSRLCDECHGLGFVNCKLCRGSGVCSVCHGKLYTRIPGFGGTGTATYVACRGCFGTGLCSFCHGSGQRRCLFCIGGIRYR